MFAHNAKRDMNLANPVKKKLGNATNQISNQNASFVKMASLTF